MAEFDSATELVDAARKVRDAGYTTAIAVLLSLELAATLLLMGAQVISEYERVGRPDSGVARPFTTLD